jgi:hypothetical protein
LILGKILVEPDENAGSYMFAKVLALQCLILEIFSNLGLQAWWSNHMPEKYL